LAKYVSTTFFLNISNLKHNTYHKHINSPAKTSTEDHQFNKYKEYMLKNGLKLVYRIGEIRDKLLAHLDLNRHESLRIDATSQRIGLCKKRLKILREFMT